MLQKYIKLLQIRAYYTLPTHINMCKFLHCIFWQQLTAFDETNEMNLFHQKII